MGSQLQPCPGAEAGAAPRALLCGDQGGQSGQTARARGVLAGAGGDPQRCAVLGADTTSFLAVTSTESGLRISQCAWFWTY